MLPRLNYNYIMEINGVVNKSTLFYTYFFVFFLGGEGIYIYLFELSNAIYYIFTRMSVFLTTSSCCLKGVMWSKVARSTVYLRVEFSACFRQCVVLEIRYE